MRLSNATNLQTGLHSAKYEVSLDVLQRFNDYCMGRLIQGFLVHVRVFPSRAHTLIPALLACLSRARASGNLCDAAKLVLRSEASSLIPYEYKTHLFDLEGC